MAIHPKHPKQRDELDDTLVQNALRLADDHRAHCSGPDCEVQLMLLVVLLAQAGIILTTEEVARFV